MKMKYKEKYLNLCNLPQGGPQDTLLVHFIFLVLIKDGDFDEQVDTPWSLVVASNLAWHSNTEYNVSTIRTRGVGVAFFKELGVGRGGREYPQMMVRA